ncbi:MAG: GGDEF domain-containing protein [Cyanobacteria bacterium P01_H01_bin.74]
MYKLIKSNVLFFIYIALSIRLFVMLWDPYWGDLPDSEGLSIYSGMRGVLTVFYAVTGYVMQPVYFLADIAGQFIPELKAYFGLKAADVLDFLTESNLVSSSQLAAFKENDSVKKSFVGYVDLLVFPTMMFYTLSIAALEAGYKLIKNIILSLFVEFSFTKRKEGQYKDALSKRASELVKLNVQYKNLTKEASVLAKSVITDELTQVYNKRFFLEKIDLEFKTAKEKKKKLAIAMVDIDHFKKLNDTYGHIMGDKVLKAVAQIANSSTPQNAFCCRFGGEEFAIIMPGFNLDQAVAVVSEIHENIPYLQFSEDEALKTSASFGLCYADFTASEAQALEGFDALIKMADDELYKAKLNGRNRIEATQII